MTTAPGAPGAPGATSAPGAPAPSRDASAAPHIHLQGVRKRFGEHVAVDGVDLAIYRGEFFALLGASGCGKTTLLRILAGFETPGEGRVIVDGTDITATAPYDRPLNMMFQSYALFPHMSVADNVAFGLRRDGIAGRERERRVGEVLDLVQLAPFARRKPHQLSGGQRQRVALARALAKRPKVLLLDEPLSALDRKLREQTQFELIRIQKQVGTTFVMVTHDQDEAMTMASRIAVMDHGRIVQVGQPQELYEFPASRFIADFVGSVNLFEGRVVEDRPDRVEIDSEEAGGTLAIGHGISGTLGMTLWFAVRPEKLRLHRTCPAGEANVVQGVVAEIAYLGDMSLFNLRLASGKPVRVTALNADRWSWSEMGFGVGDTVWASWATDAAVALRE